VAERPVYVLTNHWTFIANYFNHVIRHLSHRGVPVHAFAPGGPEPRVMELMGCDAQVHDVPFTPGRLRPGQLPRTIAHGWRMGRRDPGAVFAMITALPHLLYGPPLRLLNRRCVFVMAGMGTLFSSRRLRHRVAGAFARRIYRWLYRGRNSTVVVQNTDDRRLVIEELGAPADRVVLMPGCGVDTSVFPFFEQPPDNPRPVILVPARLIREKGIREACEASRLLGERGIDHEMRFTYGFYPGNPMALGAGDLEEMKRRNPRLTFLGWQPSLVPVYRAADVVCLPTYREGLPSTLLEGAACGRPLVTTDVPGPRDLVTHEETGLLVPPRSPEALADALQRVLTDRALAERLRRNAYRRFLEGFTKEHSLRAMLPAFLHLGVLSPDAQTRPLPHPAAPLPA
jgi:glycosyltransferase involved in cell wall biosynthesis